MSYNGILRASSEANERLGKGETLGPDDMYFVTAPTFETSSEKYGWLNSIQAVGKMISFQRTGQPHVEYDVFAIR
jgi:hypothetical protein